MPVELTPQRFVLTDAQMAAALKLANFTPAPDSPLAALGPVTDARAELQGTTMTDADGRLSEPETAKGPSEAKGVSSRGPKATCHTPYGRARHMAVLHLQLRAGAHARADFHCPNFPLPTPAPWPLGPGAHILAYARA